MTRFVVVDTVCIILVVVYIQINARGVNQIKSSRVAQNNVKLCARFCPNV